MRITGTKRQRLQTVPVIILLALLSTTVCTGQEPKPPDQTAPPPLKMVPRLERNQINLSKDEKSRIKLSLELAETHLANAETQTSQQQFDAAAAEAGMYWAIVEDMFKFMKTMERNNDRKRDLYKRLELALRAHAPRLTIMRRSTPSEYAVWIKEIEELARQGRTEALNSFYGNTVIRDNPKKSTEAKDLKKP